jgi:hypothetical protein
MASPGRPKLEFDLKVVKLFGQYAATYDTMANYLNCSVDTIRRNMQDPESEFCKSYKNGHAKMKMSLSEAQLKLALSGNPTMQIWLGRNHLAQSEHPKDTKLDAGQNILFEFGKCLPHQIAFATCRDRFAALVGGYRSGKTHSLPWRYLFQAVHRSSQGIPMHKLTISPTYRLLQDVVIPKYCESFDKLGIRYEQRKSDYEIVVMTDQFEGTIRLRSAEDPTKIIGIEATDIDIDEFDTLKPAKQREVYEKALGRLSGAPDGTLGITTTPEGFRLTYELFEEQKIGKLIQASTDENIYLPPGYIQMLYEQYPKALVDQYVKGKFVNAKFDKVYYDFHRSVHVGTLNKPIPNTLVIGMDFNVNPMTSTIGFYDGKRLYEFDEFYLANANTRIMCEHILERYPLDKYELVCYPDMPGGPKGTRQACAEQTDIEILIRHGLKVQGVGNIRVKDRINLVNLCFEKDQIFIDEKCSKLIRDLEQVSKLDNGDIDKTDTSLTHISDAMGRKIIGLFHTQQGRAESVGT